jgi:hypothetical protein
MFAPMQKRVDVGQVLSRTFSVYREQAGTLLGAGFVVFVLVGVLTGLAASTLVLLPLAFLVAILAHTLFQGMVVALVSDVQDGRRDFSVSELFSAVVPSLGALIIAAVLAFIGLTIGLILLILPFFFLATIWFVVAPVIVVERKGAVDAFGRSRALVQPQFWNVFVVILVTFLILIGIEIFFSIVGAIAGDSTVARIVVNIISTVVTAPIFALVASSLYFDLVGAAGSPAPGEPAPGVPAPATGTTAPPPPPPPPPPAGPQSPAS